MGLKMRKHEKKVKEEKVAEPRVVEEVPVEPQKKEGFFAKMKANLCRKHPTKEPKEEPKPAMWYAVFFHCQVKHF